MSKYQERCVRTLVLPNRSSPIAKIKKKKFHRTLIFSSKCRVRQRVFIFKCTHQQNWFSHSRDETILYTLWCHYSSESLSLLATFLNLRVQ